MLVGHSSDQVPVMAQTHSSIQCCWEILDTQLYRLILFLTNGSTIAQAAVVQSILCRLSSVSSCQRGGVASSIRKFALHPSEKVFAGFACGSISVGSEAETIQYIVCKMGSMHRWQWLLVSNMLGGDLERSHKSQPVPWAGRPCWWFCQRLPSCWFPAVFGGCTPESLRVGRSVELSAASRTKWIDIASP